ncbi:hypothetical protein [Chryseobacterium luteum]|uniref:hypothetical protein n=1 Tax=Chryseobacterium luteum TaxID=421531 RepID=UPI00103A9D67|nr:hypothetical protein [Chryseobacterium luteum]
MTNNLKTPLRSTPEVSRNMQETSGEVRKSQTLLFLTNGGLRRFVLLLFQSSGGVGQVENRVVFELEVL